MSQAGNSKRIAKNTLLLYVRQILILLVSLYTVRVVLNVLGIEDYGIYNVIGGVVSFFSFLSGTMASATQRFFSFALGQNDFEKLKTTFSVNCIIYIAIAIIAFLLLESVGLWYVSTQLHVPAARYEAVLWIFHFSILTFIGTILTTPFMAIIIAHEDMQIYAYVSIVEAIMKLGIVFLLVILPWDKLELYSVLLFSVSAITAVIYISICTRKYKECQFRHFYWNKEMIKDNLGFTGWTLFGQVTSVARNQAVTILLNQTFNPVVVAARAIAMNITNQINLFSNNFNVGLYPPIIKSYAANNKKEMFSLIFKGSKITFFLMWIFALPLFLEMGTILEIWLKNPPIQAVLFTRLALIEVLINSISLPITTAARAPGKMKIYESTLGTIQIVIFFASWIVLIAGYEAYSVFIVAIIANLVMFAVRLLIVSSLIKMPVQDFNRQVTLPVLTIILFSGMLSYVVHIILPEGFIFTCISIITSMIISTIIMYYVGLDRQEREKVNEIIKNRIHKRHAT